MKNKAFTLVELLGVIVLLGILGVVIIPKVGDSITNSKETAYVTQEEQIKKAAYDFIVDNTNLFDNTNTITLKLGVLKQKGYLPINIKNPKTRKNISNESIITITKTNNAFEITLNLIDLIEVTEDIDNNSPIIVLNGNYVEYVNVNSNETEINETLVQNGAKAYTSSGEELTEITTQIKIGETEKTSIKTNTLETYQVTYTVTDNDKTTSATRTVIIRDNEAPQIAFQKETNLHVSEVEDFDLEKDLIINDNYDSNPTIQINSSLANRPGNYVITYTVTDASENVTTERRVINVNDDFNKYYTNLEYIESTGTQYIDLGYKAKTNTEVRLDIQFAENQNTNFKSDEIITKIIGQLTYPNNGAFNCNFGAEVSQKNQIWYWVNKNYDGTNAKNQEYTNITNRSTMIVKSGQATFQGVTTTLDTKENDNTTNMLLLGSGTTGASFNKYDAKIYGFQIYEGTTLIKNMIPCIRKSDNKVGLYDLVNNKFYVNSGTGNFDYKKYDEDPFERKYTKLEFIGTNGTQYINLDYTAKTNTEIRLDIQLIENDNTSNGESNNKIIGQKSYTGEQFNLNISNGNNSINYWVNQAYDGTNGRQQTYTNITNRSTMIVKSGQATFHGITTELDTKENDNTTNMILLGKSIGSAFNRYDTKVYGFQIYEDDILLKDMIPVVRNSDNKIGLYDEVNDVFYTNSGTGEFIKGEL